MTIHTKVNGTSCRCQVMGSPDQKLYYRLLDTNGRPAPWLKQMQTPQSEQQFLQEYRGINATEYDVAS